MSEGEQSEERANEKVKLNQPRFLLFFPLLKSNSVNLKNIVQDKGQQVILSQ